MFESKQIENLINKYHENKLAHAFLLETNNLEKCYNEIIKLIKIINCPDKYEENCNANCNLCELINTDNLPNLIKIEQDGQFIKKNQILEMMSKFSTKPIISKYNMYIIKGAEYLNNSSGNTILKFLEEPADNILGFLITNNKEKVLPTIRSRCQVINCHYEDNNNLIEDQTLDNVKIYLSAIYNNKEDLLYNKTNMTNLYKDRKSWEIFFQTMLLYLKECLENTRTDKIEMIEKNSKQNIIKIIIFIENMLKYIRYNGNIDLILDKFVIEMRNYYE